MWYRFPTNSLRMIRCGPIFPFSYLLTVSMVMGSTIYTYPLCSQGSISSLFSSSSCFRTDPASLSAHARCNSCAPSLGVSADTSLPFLYAGRPELALHEAIQASFSHHMGNNYICVHFLPGKPHKRHKIGRMAFPRDRAFCYVINIVLYYTLQC